MNTAVKARIVRIGNSRGIRIPKLLLDQLGLGSEVEITVEGDRLTIRSAQRRPRHGWDEQFCAMAEAHDDALLDAEVLSPTDWDRDEWEW